MSKTDMMLIKQLCFGDTTCKLLFFIPTKDQNISNLAELGVRFAISDKVLSLLIIYLESLSKCFQVGVDLPPLTISKNPRWLPIIKRS